MVKNLIGENVLCTCSNWFIAPDGKEYKGVYGKLIGIYEVSKELGFIPNRSHANWFYKIGEMVIMGCQVMYIIKCTQPVNTDKQTAWTLDSGDVKEYERPTLIYSS